MHKSHWTQNLKLFAECNFQVRYSTEEHVGFPNKTIDEVIMGIYLNDEIITETKESLLIRDCKLLARPISDMSDDEVVNFFEAEDYRDDVDIPQLRRDITFLIQNDISLNRALKLLQLGVFPLPFENDKPRNVIWVYENE